MVDGRRAAGTAAAVVFGDAGGDAAAGLAAGAALGEDVEAEDFAEEGAAAGCELGGFAEGAAPAVAVGAVAAGCRAGPVGAPGFAGRAPEPGADFACEWARGTVVAIATPPATLAAATVQVTADIRTSLRRASCSKTLS